MNVRETLLLPWKIAQTSMRWLALVLFVMAVIGATAFAAFSQKPDVWVRVAGIIGIAQALIWPLCLGTTVLLTIDAQQLRLPGIQRQAVTGMLINLVLGALLPTIVIGWFGGHTLAAALIVGLMIIAGWLYSLLPRFVSTGFYLAGIALFSGKSLQQLPTHTNFLVWASLALVAGMAVVTICWRRLVLSPNPYLQSWHTPVALRLSRGISSAVASRRDRSQIIGRPEWLQVVGSLRNCGPGHPVTSLRMALGGPYMPLTFVGWLRRFAVVLMAIGALIVWFAVDLMNKNFAGVSDGNVLLLSVSCGVIMSMTFAIACLTELRMRWRSGNAELSLLALLPELGGDVKRDLLRAMLGPPLRMLLLAAALVLAMLPRIGARRDLFVLLVVVVGTAGFVITFALRVAGGCTVARWEARIVGILGFLLIVSTLIVGVFSFDPGISQANLDMPCAALLVGWLAVAVMLFRLGQRGWHGLQRRPHPFTAY